MDFKEEIACDKGLRLNKELGIIDTKNHIIHFKHECKKGLLDIICCNCDEKSKSTCKERKIFEDFLE